MYWCCFIFREMPRDIECDNKDYLFLQCRYLVSFSSFFLCGEYATKHICLPTLLHSFPVTEAHRLRPRIHSKCQTDKRVHRSRHFADGGEQLRNTQAGDGARNPPTVWWRSTRGSARQSPCLVVLTADVLPLCCFTTPNYPSTSRLRACKHTQTCRRADVLPSLSTGRLLHPRFSTRRRRGIGAV